MLISRRCKNCLIPESFPNVKLNEKRICNFCTAVKKIDKNEEKKLMKKEFEEYLNKIKGKNEYDCVLLYSGGKDSTYLLYLLTKKYGLKVLTVTVDNGLETNLSKENIQRCSAFFNVDNITITPENDFYKRLYRYLFQNKIEKRYSENICSYCFSVIISIGLNIASEKNIPIVLTAISPDQIRKTENYNKIMNQRWDPLNIKENKDFIQNDSSYFWFPEKYDKIPYLFSAFSFLEYPGVEKIIKKLESIGLGEQKKFNQLYTNCHMVWLTICLDLKKFGDNLYLEHIYRAIRYKKLNRFKWRIILTFGTWLLKNRFFKRKQINQALNHIDLKLKDLL